METTNPTLTDAHYEVIGKMIASMPGRSDEVKGLKVKELFNNEDIFDIHNGEWFFYVRHFLEEYPSIEEARYFKAAIWNIMNPPEEIPTIPEESTIKSISFAENTGGDVINDVIRLKNGKILVLADWGVFLHKDQENYENGTEIDSFIYPNE